MDNLGIKEIEKMLAEKEKKMDLLVVKSREIVRLCSNAIKAIHSKEIEDAKKQIKDAETQIKEIRGFAMEFPGQYNHIMQEYAEARIVLHAIEKKEVPSYRELGDIPEESYLNGLLDAMGEIKREMYEAMRKKNKSDAETYFNMMERIYDELLPLRFSNSILPDFRRKQDVARMQLEQARGELL